MSWSEIEVFDAANETINFGARTVAESSLCEIATLVTIRSETVSL